MRSLMILSLVITVSTGLMAQGQEIKQASAQSSPLMKALSGVWKPESIQYEGADYADPTAKEKIRLSIENGEYKLYWVVNPMQGMGQRLATSTLVINDTAKTFTIAFVDGPRKGEKLHGIFEVSGKTLKLCYGPTSKALPTKYEAPKGSGLFNESWTREK